MSGRQDGAPEFARAIAGLLRESRRRQRLTQAEVSTRTGGAITKPALANYEGGHRSLRIDIFWRLTKALGEDPGEMISAAEHILAAENGSIGTPLTIEIAALEASTDPRLEPVRRWFHMRALGVAAADAARAAAQGKRGRRGQRAAKPETVTLEPAALEALAKLMDIDVDTCRSVLLAATGMEVAGGNSAAAGGDRAPDTAHDTAPRTAQRPGHNAGPPAAQHEEAQV